MENSQQQYSGHLQQQRDHRSNLSIVSRSASNSSNFPATTEYTRAIFTGNEHFPDMFTFERAGTASAISMDPSMFMAGSWEPLLPGSYPDRRIMAQNRAFVTSSYDYPSTAYQQPGASYFDHGYPTQESCLTPNFATYQSPWIGDHTAQPLIRRRSPTLNRNSHPSPHDPTSYDSRGSPEHRIQNSRPVIHPAIVTRPTGNITPVRLSPVGTRQKRGHGQLSRRSSAEQVENHDKPYAYLLYEVLRSAEDHKMSLQEIYRWFEENTQKANDPQSKGWQSSIRHNLSMNEAFVLLNDHPARGKSKNNYWTLTEEALKNGVQSTTRYRNTGPKRHLTFDDVAGHMREATRSAGSQMGHVSKSRRITHGLGTDLNEQYQSSHRLEIPQQMGQRQSLDDMPRHGLYHQDPCIYMSQSLNPSIVITSTTPSDGLQYGYVETHLPSNQFSHDFRELDP